jgi:hypothetical protein
MYQVWQIQSTNYHPSPNGLDPIHTYNGVVFEGDSLEAAKHYSEKTPNTSVMQKVGDNQWKLV